MSTRIAILGSGRLGESMLRGFLSSGWRTADDLVVTARRSERLAELHSKYGVVAESSNVAALKGAGLVIVAAGVLAYGIHDLQEGGVLPGLNNLAFDVSATIPPSSWYGTLLKGIFNFSPRSTWAEVTVWLLYVVPVLTLFLLPKRAAPAAAAPAPVREAAPV